MHKSEPSDTTQADVNSHVLRTTKPARVPWWGAYSIGALGTALLFAENALSVSPAWHKLIGVAIVITMFGMLAAWNWRHSAALDDEAIRRTTKQQATARHVSLSPVQTQYLMAQARRAQADTTHDG